MTLTCHAQKIIGFVADTKPPNVQDWMDFLYSDTLATWKKIPGVWYETTLQQPMDYIITHANSSTYKARNSAKGHVDKSKSPYWNKNSRKKENKK